jgi:hypothetical protein
MTPSLAVVVDRNSGSPAPWGTHQYRANVHTPNGVLYDVELGRPMQEFWRDYPSFEVHPLPIGCGVPVTISGEGWFRPQYIESPVMGACDDPGVGGRSVLERLIVELERASPEVRSIIAQRLLGAAEEVRR